MWWCRITLQSQFNVSFPLLFQIYNHAHIPYSQVPLSAEVGTEGVEALMKMSDFSHIKLALGLLGWMCDGQNRTIQDYLREQPGQIKPINIVGDIALFIQKFFSGTPFEFHYSRLTDLWEKASCNQDKLGTKLAQPELPPLDQALKEWRYICGGRGGGGGGGGHWIVVPARHIHVP